MELSNQVLLVCDEWYYLTKGELDMALEEDPDFLSLTEALIERARSHGIDYELPPPDDREVAKRVASAILCIYPCP